MINFNEYYAYLLNRQKLINHFNKNFKELAENSKYLRSQRIIKKYQKDMERERATSLNILNNITKEEQKKKGIVAVVKVEQPKESKIKLFFRKLLGIKPPVIAGIIEEFSETTETSAEVQNKPEVETEAYLIDDETEEEFDDEDFEDDWEEESEDFFDDEEDYHCNDTLEGQMDIEDLNEGEVYEKT